MRQLKTRPLTSFQHLIVNNISTAVQKNLIFADFTCIGHTYLPSKFEVFTISEK